MPVPPDLQDMLDDDPEFLARFDAMLPGKRRNAMHSISMAKTDATIAKINLKLMNELGLVWVLLAWGLSFTATHAQSSTPASIELGNARLGTYLPMLEDQRVAVVGNHTSVVQGAKRSQHLVDTLLSRGVRVVHVFAPEHGFRGEAANGAEIHDGIDVATGLKVYSLHGQHRKPQPEQLEGVDVVVLTFKTLGRASTRTSAP